MLNHIGTLTMETQSVSEILVYLKPPHAAVSSLFLNVVTLQHSRCVKSFFFSRIHVT